MADLYIELLGPPKILWQGQPLRVQREATRTLLYYLACQSGPVSRQEIIDVFWPDEYEENGRKNLREVLSRLRKQLPDSAILALDHDLVSLDPQLARSDVREFWELVSSVQTVTKQVPRNQPFPQAAITKIDEALNIWRSSRFMGGKTTDFNRKLSLWFDNYGRDLEAMRVSLLIRHADHAMASNNLTEAFKLIQSALESDFFNDDLHFRALTCLIQMGERSDAITYCRRIEEKYRLESAEINEDLERLIQSARLMPITGEPDSLAGWPALMSNFLPFVGHLEPLGQLHQLMQRGGCIFITGESGVGKSRLIYEFNRSLAPATRLLLADSRPSYQNMPFQTIVEALRHSVQQNEWQQLDPAWLAYLLPLLPELGIQRPEIKPVYGAAPGNMTPIFDALRHLLLRITEKQRLVLVMDDAQWCDEASLAFMGYLIEHRFFPYHGALIIAARDEETVPALESFLSRVSLELPVQRIQLDRLARADISTLTRYTLGQIPSPDVVTRLEKDTGGNPFFLQETLRTLLNYPSSLNLVDMLDRLPLSPTISAMVYERLRPLSQPARQMIEILSVLGSQFSPAMAESAAGLPPDAAVLALEELEKAHFIRPVKIGIGDGYEFSHDKFREVILLTLSSARKRMYHLRAARAIAANQSFCQSFDVELAEHYQQAGEYSLAFKHWRSAANFALRLSAPGESTKAYHSAAQLITNQNGIIPDDEIRSFYSAWIGLAYDLNERAMLEEVSQEVFVLGQGTNNLLLKGIGLSGKAMKAYLDLQYEQASMLIEQALQFIRPTRNSIELARTLMRRGLILILRDRNDEAAESLQQALDIPIAEPGGEMAEIHARASHRLAILKGLTGWPQQAVDIARLNMEINASLNQPYPQAYASFALSLGLFYLGHYRAAQQNLQEGLQLARRMQAWRLIAMTEIWQARVELTLGHLDTCWDIVQEGFTICQNHHFNDIQAEFHAVMGEIYRLVDEDELALENFQQGAKIADNSFNRLDNITRLANLLMERQIGDNAIQKLTDAINQAKKAGLGLIFIPAQFTLAGGLIMQEKFTEAEGLIESLRQETQERRMDIFRNRTTYLEGIIALRRGEYEKAILCAETAIEGGKVLENPFVEMTGFKLLAQIPGSGSIIEGRLQRIRFLLAYISAHTQNPNLAPGWQRYAQRMFPTEWLQTQNGNVLTTPQ